MMQRIKIEIFCNTHDLSTSCPDESNPKRLPSKEEKSAFVLSFNNSFASDSLIIYSLPLAEESEEKFLPSAN